MPFIRQRIVSAARENTSSRCWLSGREANPVRCLGVEPDPSHHLVKNDQPTLLQTSSRQSCPRLWEVRMAEQSYEVKFPELPQWTRAFLDSMLDSELKSPFSSV